MSRRQRPTIFDLADRIGASPTLAVTFVRRVREGDDRDIARWIVRNVREWIEDGGRLRQEREHADQ
jgi:hypothetical protein